MCLPCLAAPWRGGESIRKGEVREVKVMVNTRQHHANQIRINAKEDVNNEVNKNDN